MLGILVFFCALQYVFGENCDHLGVLLYEDLGCVPELKSGQKCAVKYQCDFGEKISNGCFFKGRVFEESSPIDSNLTYSACNAGCRCSGGKIMCAILDCPEWLRDPQPGCYPRYKLGNCCSSDFSCLSAEECEVGEQKYKIGQRFYPENSCQVCVCHKYFNKELDDKTCMRKNCAVQIRESKYIRQKCAAVYYKDKGDVLCCPNDWVCPHPDDDIKTIHSIKPEQQDLKCDYGTRKLNVGEGFTKTIMTRYVNEEKKLNCECVIPPLVTCWNADNN